MLFLLLLTVLSSCINLVESETPLECLINEHIKVDMLENYWLEIIAQEDANKDVFHNGANFADAHSIRDEPIRTCTRLYDKMEEKRMCNNFISSREGLLSGAKDSNYVTKFGCAVGTKGDKVKACCATRTTKKQRNNPNYQGRRRLNFNF